jgi:hypothetical protein
MYELLYQYIPTIAITPLSEVIHGVLLLVDDIVAVVVEM